MSFWNISSLPASQTCVCLHFTLLFYSPVISAICHPTSGIQIFRLVDESRRNLLLWRMKSYVPSDFEMPQKLPHVIAQAWWEIWAKAGIWQFLQKWGGKAIILNVMYFTTWKGWIAFAELHRPIQQKSYKECSASILIRNCLAAGCNSTLTFNANTVTSSHQYSIPSC